MKAVVHSQFAELPTVQDVADPVCPPDGVVIDVRATGVCRSDWHAWKGHDPVDLPHIPGHEFAGVVAEVGADVTRWTVGDRVTVPFVCGCGDCEFCAAGEEQVCPNQTQPGFTGSGSFAERVAINAADTNLVALPDTIDFATAASLGCRFATAFRALTVHGRVGDGDWLAVHGCGGVGLSAVMIGKALGARVVAVDVSESALTLARDLGADAVVNASGSAQSEAATGERVGSPAAAGSGSLAPSAVADAIRELTGGGAHVSVDALGSAGTAYASVACLRRRGRHIQVGLLLGDASTPPLPMDRVIAHELEVYGSHGMAAHDYAAMLALIELGTLRPERLIGSRIGLDAAGEALAAMDHPATSPGMAVIVLPE